MPSGNERPYRFGRLRGKICLVWYDGDGARHRHSLGTDDPREAERAAPSIFAELTTTNADTVEALWKAYTIDKAGRAVIATMEHTWKAVGPRFGPMRPEAITVQDCRAHTAERRAVRTKQNPRGISDGTIHTELGHLRMVLLWGEKHNKIVKAPYIERPAKPKPSEKHLTKEQVGKLIEAATRPHIRLFVILAIGTAARSGALLDLTWDRCDFVRGLVHLENPEIDVPHKGRAVVPMNNTVRRALEAAREGAMSRYVVEWAGGKVGSVKRALAESAKRAGLAKVSPHMIRHSAAVHMAEAGTAMEEIAQYLGHSEVSVTRKIYARFSPDYLKKAASALEYDYTGSVVPVSTTQKES